MDASYRPSSDSFYETICGVPVYDDDDLAEKIVVEAYYRENPFPVWTKGYDSYFSDCES
jgi:hypothetical protein